MNTESLKIHLAEKVMCWEIYTCGAQDRAVGIWYAEHEQNTWRLKVLIKDFYPHNNIEQAMGCFVMLGTDYRIELLSDADYKFCTLAKRSRHLALDKTPMGFRTMGFWHGKGKEYEAAISLAIAKATGWEE